MLNRFRRFVIAASAIGLASVCLPALFSARAEVLPIKTYTVADGLPRDEVGKVRQDARGFLWFCTGDGLVRFDGYGFKLYSKDEGLPARGVTDFRQTRDGKYWIGTRAGLVRFNPNGLPGKQANSTQGMFAEIGYESPPPTKFAKEVIQIYEDPQGLLWIAMEDGLYQLIEKQDQPILRRVELPFHNQLGYLPIRAIFKDKRGVLWVTADHGSKDRYSTFYRLLPDGKLEKIHFPESTAAILLEAPDGTMWAGLSGFEFGLCRMVAQPQEGRELFTRCFTVQDGLPSNWVNTMWLARDGTIWIGTSAGAARFSPDFARSQPRFQVYRGVCNLGISDINADRDNNIWISTACGVTKFQRNGFVQYNLADGMSGTRATSIINDQNSNLIVVTTNDNRDMLLNLFDGNRFTPIKANIPPGINYRGYFVNSRAGDWWFPTLEWQVYRFHKILDIRQLAVAKPQAYTAKEGFTYQFDWAMYEDVRGDIWIAAGMPTKLLRWEKATSKINDLSAVTDTLKNLNNHGGYAEDRAGNLWMGSATKTASRLIRYRDGQFKIFTEADGLPAQDIAHNLMVDSKGRLWFGTSANGLGRIDDPTVEPLKITWYTRSNGLSTNRIGSLVEDQYGRIYISTLRGLECLTPETGGVRSFTIADGLPQGAFYVSARDTQCALWFGNALGVARYEPEPPKPNQPPTIFLSGVRVAGVPQQVSEIGDLSLPTLKLNSSQTNVTVDFLSPSATADPHIRYQYKLEGREDWSAPTAQRSVYFANLAAGNYRFLVRAVNADGIKSATPASVSFTIAAPVWQRWWFTLLTIGALGGLGYAAYRYRVAQLLALERMRTRIATDLHDEVGSSLSQIAILSEVARLRLTRDGGAPKDAATVSGAMEPMEKVAVTSREAVDAMSDIVWAINPQRDQLSDLSQRMRLFASDTLTARDIRLRFRAPEQDLSLDGDVRRQVFLLFKECVNNIARHANATEVEVEFLLTDHHLSLRVWDNGHGFVEPKPQPGQNGGNGLLSMRRRAAELGGRLEVISGNGNGTIIKLEAPLRPRKNQ